MRIFFLKNKIIGVFLKCCFVFLGFFSFFNITYAIETYTPLETITIGEFIYNDDYTPTIDDCTISIYSPAGAPLVNEAIMSDNATGWHYYSYSTPATEGKYPTFITCGTLVGGNLLKLDKSFILKAVKSWTVTLSDFGDTTVNTAYKARLQVLNYATVPTDADSLPAVVITDPAGTPQVPAGVMTKVSNGTYSYSYSIPGSAIGGVWETKVSIVINGETIERNDYWNLSSSPADVQIVEITDRVIPTITANVRIDNMGTSASDFYYVYCIVSSEANLCGGGDDIDSGSDTAYINAGGFINLSLTLDEVLAPGTYWFKVKARALAETNWAASTEQFTAESAPSGGGGGGGGGGVVVPPPAATCTKRADFNCDNKVNSIDFSILLYYWKSQSPFKNIYVDINKDDKVDSVDFSILLYEWGK